MQGGGGKGSNMTPWTIVENMHVLSRDMQGRVTTSQGASQHNRPHSQLVLDIVQPLQSFHKALSIQSVDSAAAYLPLQVARLHIPVSVRVLLRCKLEQTKQCAAYHNMQHQQVNLHHRIGRTINSECKLAKSSCKSHWPMLENTRTSDQTVSMGAGITPDAPVLMCARSNPSAIGLCNQGSVTCSSAGYSPHTLHTPSAATAGARNRDESSRLSILDRPRQAPDHAGAVDGSSAYLDAPCLSLCALPEAVAKAKGQQLRCNCVYAVKVFPGVPQWDST